MASTARRFTPRNVKRGVLERGFARRCVPGASMSSRRRQCQITLLRPVVATQADCPFVDSSGGCGCPGPLVPVLSEFPSIASARCCAATANGSMVEDQCVPVDPHPSAAITDGDPETFWASASDEPRVDIVLDLGSVREIEKVVITFKYRPPYSMALERSDDGKSWSRTPPQGAPFHQPPLFFFVPFALLCNPSVPATRSSCI